MSLLKFPAAILALVAVGSVLSQTQQIREERQSEIDAVIRDGALRVGMDCSQTRPCKVRFGSTVHLIKNAATVRAAGPASGLAFIYVDPSGALTAGSTVNLTCDGCKYTRGITQFPPNSIPLFTWTVVKSPLGSTGIEDFRTQLSTRNLVSGPGIMITDNEGTTIVAVDPTTVSLHASTPPRTSTSPCSTGQVSFDTDYYYFCVSTNKWRRVALSNF